MGGCIELVLATFTTPEKIGTDPASMLWLLPLVASIAVVYKATKVSKITAASFAREAAVLFGSIVVFITIAAVILCVIAWLVSNPLW